MTFTSTTTINSTNYKNTLMLVKEECGLRFNSPNILDFTVMKKYKKDEPGLIDLISDQPKVFIQMTRSLYHLYHDCFSELLVQYELTPNAKFIIDITEFKNMESLPEYIKMIFKFLNKNNIDYRPIDLSSNNIININNLYLRNPEVDSFAINHGSSRLYKFAQDYIIDKDIKATRKVYLSRKNCKNRDLSFFIKGRLPYENDDRIDDEQKAEEYFSSLGFEIIVPEDFETFEEQINFFYSVKTLVSATSSGFINACFMRPGSTMVEITTPLISFDKIGNGVTDRGSKGQEELHHFYHAISVTKRHKYFSIPNTSRKIEDIINVIESDDALKSFLVS